MPSGDEAQSNAAASREERLAGIVKIAAELLGDIRRAEIWLSASNRYLGSETPIGMMGTDAGADLVIESLFAIVYGGVA